MSAQHCTSSSWVPDPVPPPPHTCFHLLATAKGTPRGTARLKAQDRDGHMPRLARLRLAAGACLQGTTTAARTLQFLMSCWVSIRLGKGLPSSLARAAAVTTDCKRRWLSTGSLP